MAKRTEIIVKENNMFTMYQYMMPGKVQFVIFKRGACALEEVKRMVGGGHASTCRAMEEFDRLTCVEIYANNPEMFPA